MYVTAFNVGTFQWFIGQDGPWGSCAPWLFWGTFSGEYVCAWGVRYSGVTCARYQGVPCASAGNQDSTLTVLVLEMCVRFHKWEILVPWSIGPHTVALFFHPWDPWWLWFFGVLGGWLGDWGNCWGKGAIRLSGFAGRLWPCWREYSPCGGSNLSDLLCAVIRLVFFGGPWKP